MAIRIAMWSGPRNISTAMMRAWENRTDTLVWDEPLYAHYLASTGLEHPGRDAVIAAGNANWRAVADDCVGRDLGDHTIFYQKHMTHHITAEIELDWLEDLQHCFLIRDPRAVVLSYSKTRDKVSLEDIGIEQQLRLFESVSTKNKTPPLIIDSADFLANPRGHLEIICSELNVEFSEQMLSWPAGKRPSDGIWGDFWYSSVWKSTEFEAPRPKLSKIPEALEPIAEQAQPYYDQLFAQRVVLD